MQGVIILNKDIEGNTFCISHFIIDYQPVAAQIHLVLIITEATFAG